MFKNGIANPQSASWLALKAMSADMSAAQIEEERRIKAEANVCLTCTKDKCIGSCDKFPNMATAYYRKYKMKRGRNNAD